MGRQLSVHPLGFQLRRKHHQLHGVWNHSVMGVYPIRDTSLSDPWVSRDCETVFSSPWMWQNCQPHGIIVPISFDCHPWITGLKHQWSCHLNYSIVWTEQLFYDIIYFVLFVYGKSREMCELGCLCIAMCYMKKRNLGSQSVSLVPEQL